MPQLTYHLAPVDVWRSQSEQFDYMPEHFEMDGFIHCTDDYAELINVGNRYYRDDPRDYFVLVIDRGSLTAPVIYEDDAGQFPHIYGALNKEAVVQVLALERSRSGEFTAHELTLTTIDLE